ncbi:MAG: PD-(D/E)XK nuclease family protein [Burkholderiales bacterium]
MAEPRLHRWPLPPANALVHLAGKLIADFQETAPDLTGAVVVLPNLHAAGTLARALGTQAGRPLLLPKMTTLTTWAAEQPLPCEQLPDVVREAGVFAALRSRDWFESADLWHVAGELSTLLDELTQYEIALPASLDEFERALEAAYQAKSGEAMQFEARLVYELWHALSQPRSGAVDPVAGYQLQLAAIAGVASRPLYAIGLPEAVPAERAFFEEYARRAPVTICEIDANLPVASASARFYVSVWPRADVQKDTLRERAATFARQCPHSPIEASMRFYGAPGLEHEARAVDTQVRSWLNEGCSRIAVVALDRLVARRARALLERASVMADDETGWIFSTTSASTVVIRWLDAVSSGFYHQELLDLVKSPFIFAGWPQRREAVFELERAIRARSVVAGINACRSALNIADEDGSAVAGQLLDRLEDAARILRRDRRRGLHEWMSLLFASLAALDVEDGLRADPAGLQLLEYLQRLARDLAVSDALFSFSEWRRWLDRQLESAEFRDSGVSSPVIFTQLSLTRLREFDAVVLTGCDVAHLPGADAGSVFFNQSVRAQLGLPTHEQRMAQITDDLSGLLSRSARVLVTWQEMRNGEQNLLSPLFERVEVFHQLAWGNDLGSTQLAALIARAQVQAPQSLPVPMPMPHAFPAPSVAQHDLPTRISASGYNSLVACPYQFYGRYVLGLREPDEVREEMEKRDYGEYVHRSLRRFHQRYPVCSKVAREQLERALWEISSEVFRPATEGSYLSHAWALRWRSTIAAYLDWQIEREAQGWRFHAAESEHVIEIALPDATVLHLEGRIDRIDVREADSGDELAVVDYKTRSVTDLRAAICEPGEDVQLPVYAAVLGAQKTRETFFLALDGKQVKAVAIDEEVSSSAGNAIERLVDLFARMREGAALPAQGVEPACRYCEMSGLCRKRYWIHER